MRCKVFYFYNSQDDVTVVYIIAMPGGEEFNVIMNNTHCHIEKLYIYPKESFPEPTTIKNTSELWLHNYSDMAA